jgi:hypothetical protein
MTTNDARCIHEVAPKTAMPKTAFNKGQAIFTRKLELNLRKS